MYLSDLNLQKDAGWIFYQHWVRDSPLCGSYSIIDETENKLAYKKSVFKKKSTSSTATVRDRLLNYQLNQ